MNKLVVTAWKNGLLTAVLSSGRCRELHVEPMETQSLLGNIYIGKVKHIVKNIDAAFVDLGGGRTGYYSLAENRRHLVTEDLRRNGGKLSPDSASVHERSGRPLREGDEIIVQVARDAVKTKDPVLTSSLNFTGKYAVLTLGKVQIGFSSKIKDAAWKEALRPRLETLREPSFGIIVRTNAYGIGRDALEDEIQKLKKQMEDLLARGACRTCYSLLTAAKRHYLRSLQDARTGSLEAIVTDVPECYEEMQAYLSRYRSEDLPLLSLYTDESLSLTKLYRLETAMEEASGKRVWLKSGGYLVIEPTEALTVIDVNTGKYAGKKNPEETILKINLEAARETARQLTLRNLSGIILVDFIDMTSEAHRQNLLSVLRGELEQDPVKTVLVDMTKLGLVEITRKKVERPLREMLRDLEGNLTNEKIGTHCLL